MIEDVDAGLCAGIGMGLVLDKDVTFESNAPTDLNSAREMHHTAERRFRTAILKKHLVDPIPHYSIQRLQTKASTPTTPHAAIIKSASCSPCPTSG